MSLLRPHEKEGKQIFAAAGLKVRYADLDETALAVLALLACVAHRLECGDFVN